MHPSRKPNGRLKIKVEQATCDQCRAKEVTCQAPDSVDERCGQCEEGNVICTWRIGPRPMGRSPPSPEYVSYLESQVGKVEKKLREILPGVNLNRELETLSQLPSSPPRHQPTYGHLDGESQSSSGGAIPFQHVDHEPSVLYSAPQLLKQVRLASETVAEPSRSQQLRTDTYWSDTASTRPKEPRFHGQSSGEMLLKDAKEIKREFVELSLGFDQNQSAQKVDRIRINRRRPEYWTLTRPEKRFLGADFWVNRSELRLPPPDLVHSLVDLFFRYINPFFPILHRGQFELEIARGTHLFQVLEQRAQDERAGLKPDYSPRYGHYYGITHDYVPPNPRLNYQVDYTRGAGAFARVLLLVCACASRWSGDPRVLSTTTREGEQGVPSSLSSGYDFFRAIGPLRATICTQPSLWDVQIFILSALFLHGSSAHYGSWTVLGIGIRLAQDIGAHRKRDGVSIENELYKRSFWALLVLDRFMCGTFGRPSAMQDLDSDLENLVETDEEYWPVGGEPAQPAGKPCRLSFFNGMIGLSRVLGRALQTVFAIDRTRRQMGLIGHEKERELLADLRRHLERWKLTVPPHLQLQPPDQFVPSVFLDQMVSLWATYYNISILIHRPFITIKSSPLTTECLNICRTSARGCAKIMEGHLRLSETQILPSTIQAAFSTAMVLLVDILATPNAGRPGSTEWPTSEDWYPTEEKRADVEVCRRVLARAESKWHIAGRLHDTLREFQRTGNLLVGPSSSTSTMSPSSGRIQPIEPIALGSTQGSTFDVGPTAGFGAGSSAGSCRTSSVSDSNSPYESQTPYQSYGSVEQTYGSSGYHKSGYDNEECPNSQTSDSQPSNSQPINSYPYDQGYQDQTYSQPDRQHNINPGLDSGAYLPEAYYGDNTNVPFPGLVPEFSFEPNQGRGDVSSAIGYQEPLRGEIQNPNWPSSVPRPNPLSQWEQLLRNATWNMTGGAHPPS